MNVIVKNTTSSGIMIGDLCGITISGSGSLDLTEQFKQHEIAASDDLLNLIASTDITVNNGTSDLSPADAVRFVSLYKHINPLAPDGKEIIRADTRPIGTQTYFTCAGDTKNTIGGGDILDWDFSGYEKEYNSDSLENGPTVASGYRAKRLDVSFIDPVYLKDGALYFTDAPFGSNISMYITVPSGNYYPNASGTYPASALGLSGDQMYAYATNDVLYAGYVMKHHMVGDCPMGDELNAEGAQIEAVPIDWYVTGIVMAPEDTCEYFKGFGSLELYRSHTIVLPGGALGGGE